MCMPGYGVHEHHLGKSHDRVVPQCELPQGQPSYPSFYVDHMYLLIGYPLEWWIDCSYWSNTWSAKVPFLNNPCKQPVKQGNCHIQVGAGMCSSGTVKGASMAASQPQLYHN